MTLTRREFLQQTGSLALVIGGSGLLPRSGYSADGDNPVPTNGGAEVTAWVRLSVDGSMIIYSPATEMGQGSMTALPLIFAEEMDADWSRVTVEFAPQNPSLYGRKLMRGVSQMTFGSTGVMTYYPVLRQAGAQARYLIMACAAKYWGVDIKTLTTEPGRVVHQAGGKTIGYGELVPHLSIPDSIPVIPDEQLKDPTNFRLIGKNIPRNDIPRKVNGSAQFALDVRLPDMLYGMIERGRVHGAKPARLKNEADIKAMNGVVSVHMLDHGVGVIAESMGALFPAKFKLDIEWKDSKASGFNSADVFDLYEQVLDTAAHGQLLVNLEEGKEGKVVIDDGDIDQARDNAAKTYVFNYKNDYVYHAQQEPLNSVVQVAVDGSSAEVWIGTQNGTGAQHDIANALGLEPSKVVVHQQYLGGGFGRRTLSDYGVEAALLAKEVAPRPVKLTWMREDDLHYGMYRPASLQRMEAYTDRHGNLTGFTHSVVGDGERLIADGTDINGYNIPNHRAEMHLVHHGVRVKHWRAVGHGTNKFAIECMMDEIAADQNKDPIEFRMQILEPRAAATLAKAASMAGWGNAPAGGRARGVAYLERSRTLSSGICEISIDEENGKIKVHHFWSAHDAGIVIQPDSVIAQIEGGVVMGLSSVLDEKIDIVNGEVQQNNFNDYPIIRMHELPETIETELLTSSEPPAGLGESSTPLIACAVANAFFALTGKRLRHLPFTPDRVKAAMRA